MPYESGVEPHCSFCGRPNGDVHSFAQGRAVYGMGVYICDKCVVHLFDSMLSHERAYTYLQKIDGLVEVMGFPNDQRPPPAARLVGHNIHITFADKIMGTFVQNYGINPGQLEIYFFPLQAGRQTFTHIRFVQLSACWKLVCRDGSSAECGVTFR